MRNVKAIDQELQDILFQSLRAFKHTPSHTELGNLTMIVAMFFYSQVTPWSIFLVWHQQ